MNWVPHHPKTWKFRLAKLKKDVEMEDYAGHWDNNAPVMINQRIIKQGTIVKITMVSRLGDVGITDKLENDKGYQVRILLEDLEEIIK